MSEGHIVEDDSVVDGWTEGSEIVHVSDNEGSLEVVASSHGFAGVGWTPEYETSEFWNDEGPNCVREGVFEELNPRVVPKQLDVGD